MVKLPLPQYIVFYNGVANVPDKMELNLSDAFDVQDKPSCLEFTATMININWGHNEHLLDTCKKLGEYSRLVDMVRKYKSTGLTMEEAVEIAVEEAINKGILRELLRHNRGEVVSMFLREYNEQEHIENEKNISWQAGREEGEYVKLVSQVIKKMEKNHSISDIADMLEEDESVIERIYNEAIKLAPNYDVDTVVKNLYNNLSAI